MRIAFYAPLKDPTHPVPSGDRRMARLLMAALTTAGHEVTLACRLRSWDGDGHPERQARLRALGTRAVPALLRRFAPRPPELWFTYHLYHRAPDWIGPGISAALGIPYVVAEASHAAKRAHGPWAQGHAAAADAIGRAAAVVALTDADLPGLRALVSAERLFHVKPFLETGEFADAAAARPHQRAAVAARWGLPPDTPWLLAVGMMRDGDKQRSWRLLGRALAGLAGRPWVLLAVGDGPRRTCVEASFAGLPADRLRFVGALPAAALPALYAAADLYVWPSINEAYGMALLEAQAAGLPAIAGRTGGVPDLVADGATGLLPPVGDADAFAAAIATLLDDPPRRTAMRAAALAKVAAEHDIAAAASRLDAILRAVR